MSSVLLKNVVLNQRKQDILIADCRFKKIAENITDPAETVIDANGDFAAVPPFYNTHNHAAMTLLRGYSDDHALFHWLSEYIWPAEARLSWDDVYNGSRLGILEMIRSGTVFFNDMYWYQTATIRAAEEMGIRMCVGMLQLSGNSEMTKKTEIEKVWEQRNSHSPLIQTAFAPHSIYTVSKHELAQIAKKAREHDAFIHIHLSETEKEFSECVQKHGMTPAQYLDSIGLLTPKTLCAHSVWMTDADFDLLAKRDAVISHMPISNMKLASGDFRYMTARKAGCHMSIGTDGASSNNNLSMIEEMKFASLLAKHESKSPELMPASEAYFLGSRAGAEAFGLDAGVIEEGKLADCLLVDLRNIQLVPNFHLISNLVYSADSSCIDTVICNGRIIMKNRVIPNEEEIIAKARESARRISSY